MQLNGNALAVAGGADPDATLAGVVAQVVAGRNGGDWAGTTGIVSEPARVDAADGQAVTGIAVIRNSDDGVTPIYDGVAPSPWQGLPVDAGSVLVKYTYQGDANVSGTLTADDYLQIDTGFMSVADGVAGNEKAGYRYGDFNYDGKIDAADYFLIDRSYAMQGGPLAGASAGPVAAPIGSAGAAAVPEPTTLGVLAIGAVGLLGRRRHRRSR